LNFESSSKKQRPQISAGDLVYARICPPEAAPTVPKLSYDTLELSCVSATTGKSDGLGPLKGGMLFDVHVGFAKKLIRGKKEGVVVLDVLGEKIAFECIVGRNGKVWVNSEDTKTVVCVGRAIQTLNDNPDMDETEQRNMVDDLMKSMA
jgi:exosome complex component RRP40